MTKKKKHDEPELEPAPEAPTPHVPDEEHVRVLVDGGHVVLPKSEAEEVLAKQAKDKAAKLAKEDNTLRPVK